MSSASVWEISIKAGLKRIQIELEDLEHAIIENGFGSLPIGFHHAISADRLPMLHHDPFDRMLVAQATVEELRIVSHDGVFERYSLRDEGLAPIFV